ncbi:unnamed protein product [Penicillium palitans]
MADAQHLHRSLCRMCSHTKVDCNWLMRIGVMVRSTTAPVPYKKHKSHRGNKGNKGKKKATSTHQRSWREQRADPYHTLLIHIVCSAAGRSEDLPKEAEAEAYGAEGPSPSLLQQTPTPPTMLAKMPLPATAHEGKKKANAKTKEKSDQAEGQ